MLRMGYLEFKLLLYRIMEGSVEYQHLVCEIKKNNNIL